MNGTIFTLGQLLISLIGAGTLGGLVSGEVNRRLAARETRRKHLNRLLSDLLELRYTLLSLGELSNQLRGLFPIHENQVAILAPKIVALLTSPAKLHERYDAVLNELAGLDPLLAYRLRSKTLVGGVIDLLAQIPIQDPTAAQIVPQLTAMLGEAGKSVLDDAILRVSGQLGKDMLRQGREILDKQIETPEEAAKFLGTLSTIVQQAEESSRK